MMQRQFAVYALLRVNSDITGRTPWLKNRTFYVGSTITGIHARQDARWRKYRCLEQGQFVNVELVMHYPHSRDLLHEVAIIPLFNLVNATDTRSKELSIIQNWRPMYNHPWINRLHPTSTFHTTKLTITALSYTSKSSRLWKKVRRRLQTTGMLRFCLFSDVSPSMGWDLLMMLAAGGQLAFDASRRLRSSEFLIYTCLLFIVWQIILRTLLVLESKLCLDKFFSSKDLLYLVSASRWLFRCWHTMVSNPQLRHSFASK